MADGNRRSPPKGYDLDGVVTKGYLPGPHDVIITGRSYEEAAQTYRYLHKQGLFVPVYFNPVPHNLKTLEGSAYWKADMIFKLGIQDFFEDDPRQFTLIADRLKADYNLIITLVLVSP